MGSRSIGQDPVTEAQFEPWGCEMAALAVK
jgi:hypothetical protein